MDAPTPPEEAQDFLAHPASRLAVEQLLERDAMSGGFVISGPEGIGKASLAFLLAGTLLSGGRTLGETKPSVRSLIASGSHPDLVTVRRQENEKTGKLRQEIGVDQIRAANHRLQQASITGRRAVIIDLADELGREAANAFLKNLEEPPKGTAVFLLSKSPSQLLPTLTSRCRRISLKPVPEEPLAEWLAARAELSEEEAKRLAEAAEGRPGRALKLALSEGEDAAKIAESFLRAAAGKADLHTAARKFSGKGAELQAEEAREIVLTHLRRALSAPGMDPAERGRRLKAYEEARRTFRQAGTADVTQTAMIAGMRIRDAMRGAGHAR
jgi:DNA polymerase-3 subunit delta'